MECVLLPVDVSWFPPDQFGSYKSYLEVAFAVNALFGAWRAIPDRLAERRRTARRASVGKYVEELGEQSYETAYRWSRGVVAAGRGLGLVGACLIVAVLFGVPDDAAVDALGASCIALLGAPVPLAIGMTYLADWVFLGWLRVRKARGWITFWLDLFRVMRKVGRSDEIRAAWLARDEDSKAKSEH